MATHRIAKEGFVIAGQPVAVGTLVDEAEMSPFAVRGMEESGLIVRLTEDVATTPEVASEIVNEVIEAEEMVEEKPAPVKKAPAKKVATKKTTATKKP